MADETTAPRASLERFVPALLAAILLLQGLVTWRYLGAVAGAADSSGYMNSARLLARGEFSAPFRVVEGVNEASGPDYFDEFYAPLGFRPMLHNGTISPIYPIGLPLLIAAVAKATNWNVAPGLVMMVHALLGVVLTFELGRQFGLPPGWAALGTLILAASPLFFNASLSTMSDVPSLVWTTAAILLARAARQRPAWALAAGLVVGMCVLMRPTGALALLPAAVALAGRQRASWLFVLGGMPAAGLLALYNLKAYGGVFTTGYFAVPDLFALSHVGPTLVHYAIWLPLLLTPLVLAAVALPWLDRVASRDKWMLGVWVLAFLAFYACYTFTQTTWWFLRFVLPAFPPMIVAALLGLRAYSRRKPWRVSPVLAWAAVGAVILAEGALWSRALRVNNVGKDEEAYRSAAAWMQTHVPPSAVVLAMQDGGALYYYTDFRVLRAEWFKPEKFRQLVPVIRAAGRPIYAILHDFEIEEEFSQHIPGNWVKIDRVFNRTVWRLEP